MQKRIFTILTNNIKQVSPAFCNFIKINIAIFMRKTNTYHFVYKTQLFVYLQFVEL